MPAEAGGGSTTNEGRARRQSGPPPMSGVEGRGGVQRYLSGTVAEELAPLSGLKLTLIGTFTPW